MIVNNKDIVVIADTQIDKDSPTKHLEALSRYLWKHKPSTWVHIGDHFDLPSLSSYASPLQQEGKRLVDDIDAGIKALDKIADYVNTRNIKSKRQFYSPNKLFIEGNHENRLNRYMGAHPELLGLVDIPSFIECAGWSYSKLGEPIWVGDVCFNHYMENPMSGKPVGGSMENKLNKFPHSFVHGHQQQFQYARRQNLKGKPHFGVCAGAFYMHDEDYRGANNTEIRGFVHLKHFINRYGYDDYDVEFISLERLLEQY
jgi:hypothetical protein